jgi:phosphoglycolate phosphatase-like HAD superfamily hydrolase
MDRLGWVENGQVALTIASDEVAAGRPSPLMIQQLMEKLGIQNSSEVLKVGDTMVDIQEGRNAECGKVIGITTGTYSREQLEVYAPDHIIDNLLDLKQFL